MWSVAVRTGRARQDRIVISLVPGNSTSALPFVTASERVETTMTIMFASRFIRTASISVHPVVANHRIAAVPLFVIHSAENVFWRGVILRMRRTLAIMIIPAGSASKTPKI